MTLKELILSLMPILLIILRNFLIAKLGRQEVLESAKKVQKELDQAASRVVIQNLEMNQKIRSHVKLLQDEMDQNIPK